jgi:hypothetical protein
VTAPTLPGHFGGFFAIYFVSGKIDKLSRLFVSIQSLTLLKYFFQFLFTTTITL